MAAESVRGNVALDVDLLALAQQLGFTKQGEMFSAIELNELATRSLASHGCTTRLVNLAELSDDAARLAFVLDALRRGELLLIAYDADKDNTPCTLGGARAHWAIIKGIVVPFERDAAAAAIDDTSDSLSVTVDSLDDSVACDRVALDDSLLSCQHSKSKRAALWSARALLASSAQLARPDHARNVAAEYRMLDDLAACLAARVIVVAPAQRSTETATNATS